MTQNNKRIETWAKTYIPKDRENIEHKNEDRQNNTRNNTTSYRKQYLKKEQRTEV